MGVPRFAQWILKRCAHAFGTTKTANSLAKLNIETLYIDGNSLVHPASQKVTATGSYENGGSEFIELPFPPGDKPLNYRNRLPGNSTPEEIEKAIFEETCYVIEAIVFVVVPRKNVYIVFDGAPPLGKQSQQRQRRWSSAQTRSKNTDNPLSKHWDSCAISPGTQFMDRLQSYMRWWVRTKMTSGVTSVGNWSEKNPWQQLTIVIDGSNVPGEGEHKIMRYIRNSKGHPRQIIYGLDADIFMLSLATHRQNIYLLREDPVPRNRGTNSFLHNGPALDARWNVVQIDTVSQWLYMGYPQVYSWGLRPNERFGGLTPKYIERRRTSSCMRPESTQETINNAIVGVFIFLNFFVGNDFIPPLSFCQVLNTSLSLIYDAHKLLISENSQKYKKYSDIFITSTDKINWRVLIQLFVKLKDIEPQKCWELACHQRTKLNDDLIDEDLIKYFGEWFGKNVYGRSQKAMHVATERYKEAYYRRADIVDSDGIDKICAHYIQTLGWVNSYYHSKLLSWRWYYPYGYAPFPSDLVKYMIKLSTPVSGNNSGSINEKLHTESGTSHKFKLESPLSPFQQLMCILPSESRKLLPPEYDEALDRIPGHFPTTKTVKIDTQGKEVEWQAVVTLPPLQLDKIIEVYNNVSENARVYRRNVVGDPRKFVWNPDSSQIYRSRWGVIEGCKVLDLTHTPNSTGTTLPSPSPSSTITVKKELNRKATVNSTPLSVTGTHSSTTNQINKHNGISTHIVTTPTTTTDSECEIVRLANPIRSAKNTISRKERDTTNRSSQRGRTIKEMHVQKLHKISHGQQRF